MAHGKYLLGCFWVTVFLLFCCAQASHNHDHAHLHTRQQGNFTANATSGSAEELVKQALAALSVVNKARLENPKFNENTAAPDGLERHAAPPLDIKAFSSNSSATKRQEDGSETDTSSYSLPSEVVEAARVVAEANPPRPSGNHSSVAALTRQKYALDRNDTNAPAPLTAPDGFLGNWGRLAESAPSGGLEKRASSYWMADLPQRGYAPHAPDGYKVWRNVKDYGAKGDGVTDDTAAINLAIADGNRCGVECGSSSKTPAVIWFPGGTYLVSSPIIQYYNTQFLGDPFDVPTILAAQSFVGLGVITSDVYVSDKVEWYITQNNFLRSIRNFKLDIRATDPTAYVCAIHWQVAQATSLENIEFYMLYNSEVPQNTQQGIYMENGSGGFLADLTFVGGNFGAYFGNQQFTTSHLVFVNCKTAVQVHWDWAWTMQDYVIESCTNGLVITSGAGAPKEDSQGVGSLILVDTLIANTPNAIITTLQADYATSFLIQNVGFFNVETAVQDGVANKVLLAGGDQVLVDSWGFGRIVNATGVSTYVSGENIPSMTREPALLGSSYDGMNPNLFTRRRPTYYNILTSRIMDVRALGAKGDGTTDDTFVLNSILEGAANTSSIVYFPYGVYIITDTLRIPLGSRIIGQAWPQIMASGSKFGDEFAPRVAVEVGKRGERGIVEIQDILFTVRGPAPGAVLMEWNAHESSQGSVGLWDSHFIVGGITGSNLQVEQCPKLTGTVNPNCKGASLLMHLTPDSSIYMENVWMWVADHDNDMKSQDQIDVYGARGLLIESTLAWLWGTAVEHSVLYQYQLSQANNILMGMVQTESPYFQPTPEAPQPFTSGLFPNDPTFANCTSTSGGCATSWAVRIIDSSTIYILGSGLYSWFSNYKQDCLDTEDCQTRAFEIEESYDIWIYNLCTKAIVEMISPKNAVPTFARDNVNGFLSSILGWLQGAKEVVGNRNFPGFQIYPDEVANRISTYLPSACLAALRQKILCDDTVAQFSILQYHGTLNNETLTDSVCDTGCGDSLRNWFTSVERACQGYELNGATPTVLGGRMWAGYNETCLLDESKTRYCNDVISRFTTVASIEDMPQDELCSYCYVERISMMQRTSYSKYDDRWKTKLEYIQSQCGTSGATGIPPSIVPALETNSCMSNILYTTTEQTTCDAIALGNSVSSAVLYSINQDKIFDCSNVNAGLELCLPQSCALTYEMQLGDTCHIIERNSSLRISFGDVQKYNPWIAQDCSNLVVGEVAPLGRVICISPQGGQSNTTTSVSGDTTIPSPMGGYSPDRTLAPENATLADGTTTNCGVWKIADTDDTCVSLALYGKTSIDILMTVNPSLGTNTTSCGSLIVPDLVYCTSPWVAWNLTTDYSMV